MAENDEVKVHMTPKKKQPASKPAKPSIPHNRGRMMDFAPRRRTPASIPVAKPAPRSPRAPVVPTEAVETIETTTVATTVALPGYVEEREPEPILNPEDIQRPEPVEPVSPASYRPVPPAHDPNSPFLSSVNVEKRPLSDQPMMAAPMHLQHSGKNIYHHPQYEDRSTHSKAFDKTEVLPCEKRPKIKMSMIFLIIATVLLGVAIGVLVYFAIFNNR